MNLFTRTRSGIGNLAKFHGADYIVFTEGKVIEDEDNDDSLSRQTIDEKYYSYLTAYICKGKTFKIKSVGNRKTALEYEEKIRKEDIKNAFVIIDKDLDGIKQSTLNHGILIKTHGYSWENDIWNESSSITVLERISNFTQKSKSELLEKFRFMKRRLHLLFSCDAAMQINGSSLISKTSKTGGIGINYRIRNIIPAKEIGRLISAFRNHCNPICSATKSVLSCAMKSSPDGVIQGHIWSYSCYGIISDFYRKIEKDTKPSNKIIVSILLDSLRENPASVLNRDVITYYKDEFHHLGII